MNTSMGKSILNTEDPELSDRFNRVLSETVEAIEEAGIRYVFIGGIASGGLGRPRSTHDIDLFVIPEEAELTLRALAKHGFVTEKTDPSWLYKAFKDDILVDVIFKSKGDIYLDTEMYRRITVAEFHGKRLRLVSPEDLIIIKAAAHSELTPSHWHDAIALLSYATIDWTYLLKRARRAPRRILSLLLYAQSNDVWVPNFVIHELYSGIFENTTHRTVAAGASNVTLTPITPPSAPISAPLPSGLAGYRYAAAHLRERLAEDPRTNELDIQIHQGEEKLLLRGEVPVQDRKDAVEKIAQELFPGLPIENQIRISKYTGPTQTEEFG